MMALNMLSLTVGIYNSSGVIDGSKVAGAFGIPIMISVIPPRLPNIQLQVLPLHTHKYLPPTAWQAHDNRPICVVSTNSKPFFETYTK